MISGGGQMEAEQESVEPAPIEAEAEPVPEAEAVEAPEGEEAPDLSVMLRGRCAIFPDQPLPQLSSKHAVAFSGSPQAASISRSIRRPRSRSATARSYCA